MLHSWWGRGSAPTEYLRRLGVPCSAARDQMLRCEQGTRHTATFASLDLRKAGAKIRPMTCWAQGGAATEQVHGTYAKTANQRLSYCRWCCLATPPYSPNAKTRRFGIRNHPKHTTHELQHTAGTTSPSVTPWEFAGVVWEVACSSEKPGWAHDTAKTKVSGGNGTWDAAGGHLNGTWPPRAARSYPPFVTQRNRSSPNETC